VIVVKGGQTEAIKATFMQRSLTTWENAEDYVLDYPTKWIKKISPQNLSILEIVSQKQLKVIEIAHSLHSTFEDLQNKGWSINYGREFHMTDDAKLFPPKEKWEEKNLRQTKTVFFGKILKDKFYFHYMREE